VDFLEVRAHLGLVFVELQCQAVDVQHAELLGVELHQ
jgi:hypothetical protein